MRICSMCKESKELVDFPKSKYRKSGVQTYCLVCNRLRVRKYLKTPEGRDMHRKSSTAWRKRTGYLTNSNRPQPTFIYRNVLLSFLRDRDGFECGFCGLSLENSKINIDHKKPRALGGLDEMQNLRLSHAICNNKDSHKIRMALCGV